MHRTDNSKFMLFIEPDKSMKSATPINDELTEIIGLAVDSAVCGTSNYSHLDEKEFFEPDGGYKGIHHTGCGQSSNNCDYLLKNGMITNSLATYYLAYYRDAIPETEMEKVMETVKFYKNMKSAENELNGPPDPEEGHHDYLKSSNQYPHD